MIENQLQIAKLRKKQNRGYEKANFIRPPDVMHYTTSD